MDKTELTTNAMQWLEDWNARDMEKIMKHYADDVVLYSPSVIRRWNVPDGKLTGKEAVRKHFAKGLEEVPALHVVFHSILFGINSIILFYARETGMKAADFILFDSSGKVKEVRACYAES